MNDPKWTPTEIAYFLPGSGKGWKRAIPKTERAFDKLVEKLIGEGAVMEFSTVGK